MDGVPEPNALWHDLPMSDVVKYIDCSALDGYIYTWADHKALGTGLGSRGFRSNEEHCSTEKDTYPAAHTCRQQKWALAARLEFANGVPRTVRQTVETPLLLPDGGQAPTVYEGPA